MTKACRLLYTVAQEANTMKNNLTEKLKIAMIKQGVNQIELAKRVGQTQSNLSQKFVANNFKLSEYERLITALGCELEITIITPNGERI